jgi:hypothetical protein
LAELLPGASVASVQGDHQCPGGDRHPPSATRLSGSRPDPWFCVPASRRVCPYREGVVPTRGITHSGYQHKITSSSVVYGPLIRVPVKCGSEALPNWLRPLGIPLLSPQDRNAAGGQAARCQRDVEDGRRRGGRDAGTLRRCASRTSLIPPPLHNLRKCFHDSGDARTPDRAVTSRFPDSIPMCERLAQQLLRMNACDCVHARPDHERMA